MIEPTPFLTIYCTFEDVDAPGHMLAGILEESARSNARVVVHDCSVKNREPMRRLMDGFKRRHDFFFIQSDFVSMGFARNLALGVARELFVPEFVCMVEDDHGYRPGLIPAMVDAMRTYYGRPGPDGLRFGLFTACPYCWGDSYRQRLQPIGDGHACVRAAEVSPLHAGGANSCFRCAPSSHWQSVLRGYDTDEYPISTFQTAGLNLRNYHKGFTALVVKSGALVERYEREGRGFTTAAQNRSFDAEYARRDPRSRTK